MNKVSVVIPVYGQWNLVKRNIDSLLKYERDNIAEIIAVDDCSPEPNFYEFDNSIVRIIQNESNLGYAGTVNNGLGNAVSEIIVLLDSDAYLFNPIIDQLRRIYDIDPSVGCIGFGSINELGQVTGSFGYENTLIGFLLGKAIESTLIKIFTSKKSLILPYSCCVSFRNQCLKDMNYLDQETFPVLEADNDLSTRIHKSRWKLIYDKSVIVIHEGGSSYKVNSKRVRMSHEAKWRFFKKHNKLKYPKVIKECLLIRVLVEIFILKGLRILKNNQNIGEKLIGRKELLNDIKNY